MFKRFFGSINKMDFLIAFYIGCLTMAELLGSKTFPLINIFGYQLNSSVGIFLFPLLFTVNDVVTEVYGKERTRSIIRSGLIMIAFLFVFTAFATLIEPSARFKNTESAYDTVFGTSIRISAASLIAFSIAEFTDVVIFTRIRAKLGKRKLWLRNNLSNFIAQFLDTSIFMTLAFYAFEKNIGDNIVFLLSLILPYWILKCAMSIVETPLVYAGVNWLKAEKNAG